MKAKFKNSYFNKLTDAEKIAANSKKTKFEFDDYIKKIQRLNEVSSKKAVIKTKSKKITALILSLTIGFAAIGVSTAFVLSNLDNTVPGNFSFADGDEVQTGSTVMVKRKPGTVRYKVKATQNYNNEKVVFEDTLYVGDRAAAMNVGGTEYDQIDFGVATLPITVEVWSYDANNKRIDYQKKVVKDNTAEFNNKKINLIF